MLLFLCALLLTVVGLLRVVLLSCVYLCYLVCIILLCVYCYTLVAGLLTRSQYPEGPANGHLGTGFSWFPCVYKRMLRWFSKLHVTAWFSCSQPDLNFLDPFSYLYYFIFIYVHNNHCHRVTAHLQLNILLLLLLLLLFGPENRLIWLTYFL